MQPPILIGQAPGPKTDPRLPLYPVPRSATGGRLQEMMGLSRGHYLMGFDRVNVLQDFPGRTGRDDKFPMRQAVIAASAMKGLLVGRTVLLIGRNVAQAFKMDAPFLEWVSPDFCERLAVVPHLSGRNHWYNDPVNKELARTFLTTFARDHIPDKELLPSIFSRRTKQAALLEAVRQEIERNEDDNDD